MRRVLGMLLALAGACALAGCGQKGPLTLPPAKPDTPPAAATPAPPPASAVTAPAPGLSG